MLDRILTALTDLPVIIQGAIGSGLFALVFYLGQKLYALGRNLITKQSKTRRRKYLIEEIAKHRITIADSTYAQKNAFVSMLIYRAMRSLFKALLCLSLGLLFSLIGYVFGIVGYLGAIYFLFQGLNTVRATTKTDDKAQKINELQAELELLKESD